MTTTTNLEEVLRKATDMQFIGSRTIEAARKELRYLEAAQGIISGLIDAIVKDSKDNNSISGFTGARLSDARAWLAALRAKAAEYERIADLIDPNGAWTDTTIYDQIVNLLHDDSSDAALLALIETARLNNVEADKVVDEYSKVGAAEVWRSWRDTMLAQSREVNEKFMKWPIPERDERLDAVIAGDVVKDFLVWAEAHRGLRLAANAQKEDQS